MAKHAKQRVPKEFRSDHVRKVVQDLLDHYGPEATLAMIDSDLPKQKVVRGSYSTTAAVHHGFGQVYVKAFGPTQTKPFTGYAREVDNPAKRVPLKAVITSGNTHTFDIVGLTGPVEIIRNKKVVATLDIPRDPMSAAAYWYAQNTKVCVVISRSQMEGMVHARVTQLMLSLGHDDIDLALGGDVVFPVERFIDPKHPPEEVTLRVDGYRDFNFPVPPKPNLASLKAMNFSYSEDGKMLFFLLKTDENKGDLQVGSNIEVTYGGVPVSEQSVSYIRAGAGLSMMVPTAKIVGLGPLEMKVGNLVVSVPELPANPTVTSTTEVQSEPEAEALAYSDGTSAVGPDLKVVGSANSEDGAWINFQVTNEGAGMKFPVTIVAKQGNSNVGVSKEVKLAEGKSANVAVLRSLLAEGSETIEFIAFEGDLDPKNLPTEGLLLDIDVPVPPKDDASTYQAIMHSVGHSCVLGEMFTSGDIHYMPLTYLRTDPVTNLPVSVLLAGTESEGYRLVDTVSLICGQTVILKLGELTPGRLLTVKVGDEVIGTQVVPELSGFSFDPFRFDDNRYALRVSTAKSMDTTKYWTVDTIPSSASLIGPERLPVYIPVGPIQTFLVNGADEGKLVVVKCDGKMLFVHKIGPKFQVDGEQLLIKMLET